MTKLVLRRLVWGLFTIFVVYTLTFVMVVTIPGNPFQSGERTMSPEIVEALRSRYNMDNNWMFYWQFLRGAVVFDFGPSFTYNDWTCSEIIISAFPVSAMLGILAILIALAFGVPIGVLGAARHGRWVDRATSTLALLGVSIPAFVVGSALLTVFGVWLRLAPIGGWGALSHLPLPALALAMPYTAYIARLTRGSMLEAISSDYFRTALAKGFTRRQALVRHALKPALLPVLSYLGPATAQAMTGSFVIEKVFGVPGLGQHFVNAALNLDTGLMLGSVLVFASLLVFLNLLVDLLYAYVDPRISDAV